jgi:hypothetical protein
MMKLPEFLRKYAGKPTPDDKGEMAVMVSSSADMIRLDFGTKITWFAMPKPQAINFAVTILKHCGVPVNINIAPVPLEPPPEGKPV